MRTLTDDQVRTVRMRAQHLEASFQASNPVEVVRDLCGLQAQDLGAARMGVWARTYGLHDAGVEDARVTDRSIVRTWAMRGTLHLLAAEDVGWIRSLLLPRFVSTTTARSRQLGLDDATYRRALTSFARILEGRGPLTRQDLRDGLEREGIDASGQRMPYLLDRASMEGLICEGPIRSGKPTYVLTSEWLGEEPGQTLENREEALSRLVSRFLKGYAPAAPEDLAVWSGLPLSTAREAFDLVRSSLVEVRLADRNLWLLEEPEDAPGGPAGALLLPAFDTYLLGYHDRSLVVDGRYVKRVNAGGGIVKPAVMVDGRVAGTWMLRRAGGVVEVTPFEPLNIRAMEELEDKVKDLSRFLGLDLTLAS